MRCNRLFINRFRTLTFFLDFTASSRNILTRFSMSSTNTVRRHRRRPCRQTWSEECMCFQWLRLSLRWISFSSCSMFFLTVCCSWYIPATRHLARELYTVIPETSCHVYLRQRVCHHDGDTTVDNPRLWRKRLVRLGGFCCWTLLVNCLPYIRSDARNPMKVKVAWEGRFKSSSVFAIDVYAGFKEVHDLFLVYFVSLFLWD